ncbi:hypothetical protein KRR26_03505 [Corallococcus sp. M34]|uniref:hypothetical protein n=1 Tax=Citreicoccus inhibens TaxID=2849499 RepID=UPI001C23B668|nr:hypothetical protein [Citreicoccus inhibens]MBU8894651.1 hypothetical protein [Citreicoccus inhibens]
MSPFRLSRSWRSGRALLSVSALGAALVFAPTSEAAPTARKGSRPAATATKKAGATKKTAKARPSAGKKSEQLRVAVLASGPLAAEARTAVEAELARRAARYTLVPESQVRAAASRHGEDPTQADGAADVARELNLAAIIVVDTSGPAGKQQLRLSVRNGNDGKALASPAAARVPSARTVPASVKRQWPAVERGLGKARAPAEASPDVTPLEPATQLTDKPATATRPTSPPPPAEPPPTPPPAETRKPVSKPPVVVAAQPEKPATPDDDATPMPQLSPERSTIVEGAVGLRLLGRTLRYRDDVFQTLRPYTLGKDVAGYALPGAPQVAGTLTVYPAAAFSHGPMTRLGLTGGMERSLVLHSTGATGATRYPTVASEWRVGLRYVLPLDSGGRSAVDFSGTYGQHAFRIDPAEDGSRPADVPNVAYDEVGVDVGLRMAVTRKVEVGARVGYLLPLGAGELSSDEWFPHTSMGGITASLGLAYRLTQNLDVRLSTELKRYFFKFKPEVGDSRVAGGAVDQYPGLALQVGFRL